MPVTSRPLGRTRHKPARKATFHDDSDQIHYDDEEYKRWMDGGPPATPHKGEPGRRNPTAIFKRGTFTRQQNGTKRFLAVLLALISLTGAVIWGGGGPGAWAALTPLWWGVVGAAVLQVVLTYGQWVFGGPGWWNPLYLICWGVSTTTTVLGYWPMVHGWLTAKVLAVTGAESTAGYYAPWIAGAIIIIVAAAMDWLPEQTLLD